MNPILQELENKHWIWTAANAQSQTLEKQHASSGFEALDKVLSGGFPSAGMVHMSSRLGTGELRFAFKLMSQLKQGHADNKLIVFIAAPFLLNAEFLLSQNIDLSRILLIQPDTQEEALWSAEQCSKSGACEAVFLWQQRLQHTQIRKLELAALHGQCPCFWFDNSLQELANLPLSLSMSLAREGADIKVQINKQKQGWAKPAVSLKLPFSCRLKTHFKQRETPAGELVSLQVNNNHQRYPSPN